MVASSIRTPGSSIRTVLLLRALAAAPPTKTFTRTDGSVIAGHVVDEGETAYLVRVGDKTVRVAGRGDLCEPGGHPVPFRRRDVRLQSRASGATGSRNQAGGHTVCWVGWLRRIRPKRNEVG